MNEKLREEIKRVIVENLKGNYYCDRVWSAWDHNTMTEEDFTPSEESDSIDDFADEILKLIDPSKHEIVEPKKCPYEFLDEYFEKNQMHVEDSFSKTEIVEIMEAWNPNHGNPS